MNGFDVFWFPVSLAPKPPPEGAFCAAPPNGEALFDWEFPPKGLELPVCFAAPNGLALLACVVPPNGLGLLACAAPPKGELVLGAAAAPNAGLPNAAGCAGCPNPVPAPKPGAAVGAAVFRPRLEVWPNAEVVWDDAPPNGDWFAVEPPNVEVVWLAVF